MNEMTDLRHNFTGIIPSDAHALTIYDKDGKPVATWGITEGGDFVPADLSSAPGIGHNKPPEPLTPIQIRMHLSETEAPLVKRRDDLLAGVARFEAKYTVEQTVTNPRTGESKTINVIRIDNDEDQGKAGDFVKQIDAHAKLALGHFTPAKKPYLEGGRVVDAFFNDLKTTLAAMSARVRAPMDVYSNEQEAIKRAAAKKIADDAAEAARQVALRLAQQQREEAARVAAQKRDEYVPPKPVAVPEVTFDDAVEAAKIAEAAARAAKARPAEFSRVRGENGAVSSLVQNVEVSVSDPDLIPPKYRLLNEALATKDALADAELEIPGVTITRSLHNRIR